MDTPLDGRGAVRTPTTAEIFRRVEDLPYSLSAVARSVLNSPGLEAHFLCWLADRLVAAVQEMREYSRPLTDAEAGSIADLADILRDAAPLFPSPPKNPANRGACR